MGELWKTQTAVKARWLRLVVSRRPSSVAVPLSAFSKRLWESWRRLVAGAISKVLWELPQVMLHAARLASQIHGTGSPIRSTPSFG